MGRGQTAVEDVKQFDKIVATEFRERLARGEIVARGKRGLDDNALERATEQIPADFWVDAFLQPHGEIALASDNRSMASRAGSSDGAAYRAIILRKPELERVWPPRVGNGPTPLSLAVEQTRARIDSEKPMVDRLSQAATDRATYERKKLIGGIGDPVALGDRLLDEDAKRAERDALKDKRRQQIATLRDAAVAYGRKPDYAFRGHLEKVRAFADIRRYLGDDFKTNLLKQRTSWSMPQGAHYGFLVQQFLDELDRLETDWNL